MRTGLVYLSKRCGDVSMRLTRTCCTYNLDTRVPNRFVIPLRKPGLPCCKNKLQTWWKKKQKKETKKIIRRYLERKNLFGVNMFNNNVTTKRILYKIIEVKTIYLDTLPLKNVYRKWTSQTQNPNNQWVCQIVISYIHHNVESGGPEGDQGLEVQGARVTRGSNGARGTGV